MRLLHANDDGSFSLTSFTGNNIPIYAILSHTWEADEHEFVFQDQKDGTGRNKRGYRKVQFCSQQAQKDNLRYFWVDSCCIDQSSSAELSTAINSMFRWYRNAAKCYVYLTDVSTSEHSQSPDLPWKAAFSGSRWFKRGWTLQELLAPVSVFFFSREGILLGDKESLESQIQEITKIPIEALRADSLSQFSTKERMSWAANRETTIDEDRAYSLLGIFDIHMPLLYGEGVENALRRLQEEIEKHTGFIGQLKLTKEEKKCLQALRTSEYEQFKDRNPDRLEGTCQWLLRHNHFKSWEKSDCSSLLWVSADPGCGKSVLAKSLADQELKTTEARLTCYFFFKDDSEKQKSVTTALSALLHQLLSQKQQLIHHAIQDYAAEGNQLPQSFHKLWSILVKAASDSQAGQVVCILDALDECEESGRYQIIDALNKYYQRAPASGQSTPRLNFLVTSRPYLDIERRFTTLIQKFPIIRLRGETESGAISREIDIVIKSRVLQFGSELHLDTLEQSELQSKLLSITHRTYLWIKLVFDLLRDEINLTKKKLNHIIDHLPSTIDQVYEAILSKSRDRKRAQKILHIVVAATRPLTLTEMNIALCIEDYHTSYQDLELENEERFETTIRNICGLFVSVIDKKIYLLHQTAKDFLVAKNQISVTRWKHSLDPFESELIVARTCIAYLVFSNFESHIDQPQGEAYGYFDFAASYWADHYRHAQNKTSDKLLQSVLKLYQIQIPRYQNWFNLYWKVINQYSEIPKFASDLMAASYFGHDIVVKLLLETDTVDVDSKDDSCSRTPLSWASENGHDAVVKLLLETYLVDVDSKDDNLSRTPLSWAANNGHETVVKLLLETNKVDIDSKDYPWSRTPLSRAAENGHEAVVKLLLETNKVDVDSKDDDLRRTPLLWAAKNEHEAVVKLLLETDKVDIDAKDIWGRSPLSLAAESGHEAVVKLLLETDKVDIDSQDSRSRTPLSWAAENEHEAVVKLLQSAIMSPSFFM